MVNNNADGDLSHGWAPATGSTPPHASSGGPSIRHEEGYYYVITGGTTVMLCRSTDLGHTDPWVYGTIFFILFNCFVVLVIHLSVGSVDLGHTDPLGVRLANIIIFYYCYLRVIFGWFFGPVDVREACVDPCVVARAYGAVC